MRSNRLAADHAGSRDEGARDEGVMTYVIDTLLVLAALEYRSELKVGRARGAGQVRGYDWGYEVMMFVSEIDQLVDDWKEKYAR